MSDERRPVSYSELASSPRFVEKFEPDADGCLIWTSAVNHGGYALYTFAGRQWRVNRLVFLTAHSFLPEVVMHRCDKPLCVRLSCLMPGTHTENNRDRARKGRGRKSKADAVQVREDYATGLLTQAMIGELYGLKGPRIGTMIREATS